MFLEIRGIRKSFGEGDSLVEVLKGIDLSVEKENFVCCLDRRGRVCQDTFCGFSKLNDLSVKKSPKTSCLQMS